MKDIEKMSNTDIAQYLRNERNCALILWQTDDVIMKAKQMKVKCSEEDAIDIISMIDDDKDCNYGITWLHIENAIDSYFLDTKGDIPLTDAELSVTAFNHINTYLNNLEGNIRASDLTIKAFHEILNPILFLQIRGTTYKSLNEINELFKEHKLNPLLK